MASTPGQIKAKARSLAASPTLVDPRITSPVLANVLQEILELLEDIADYLSCEGIVAPK